MSSLSDALREKFSPTDHTYQHYRVVLTHSGVEYRSRVRNFQELLAALEEEPPGIHSIEHKHILDNNDKWAVL